MLASTTDTSAAVLPPTEDAFRQHVPRASYQTAVWCSSHVANLKLWNPAGNGWKLTDNQCIGSVVYTNEVALTEVRDLTLLYCSEKDCNAARKCPCLQTGLQCTEFCSCQSDCQNRSMPLILIVMRLRINCTTHTISVIVCHHYCMFHFN